MEQLHSWHTTGLISLSERLGKVDQLIIGIGITKLGGAIKIVTLNCGGNIIPLGDKPIIVEINNRRIIYMLFIIYISAKFNIALLPLVPLSFSHPHAHSHRRNCLTLLKCRSNESEWAQVRPSCHALVYKIYFKSDSKKPATMLRAFLNRSLAMSYSHMGFSAA